MSSNNVLAFIEATLANLGATTVGLFRADSGFYDKTIVAFLKGHKISHIISARLTQALQQAIVDEADSGRSRGARLPGRQRLA